ncbi:MAG TPA: beta-L-arabinofuranosidase domain-containing protein, partial [Microbacterium sp.]|nr:beta-L-arabinofuranosidase domain-containing protein [Microbacterium sp.]
MTSHTIAPVVPARGRLRPLGIDEVRIDDGFWAERQRVNGANTLAHIAAKLESEGWLPNFDLAAAGTLPQGRRGREFADSEVYKYLEALAWEIGRTGDEDLEQRFRAIVARVAAAQEDDGYLNTRFGRPGQGERWSDLEWGHELYCLGHLFQAAVARGRTRPDADDGLLDVAVRAADLVCRE